MITPSAQRFEISLARLVGRAVVPGARQIGVDAVDIADFSRHLDAGGRKLAARWFTDAELRFADGERDRLAATLAGKEAVAKVLGTGIRGPVRWKMIEILRRADGAPFVLLHDGARARARELDIGEIAISLCHESTLAMAVASGVPMPTGCWQ